MVETLSATATVPEKEAERDRAAVCCVFADDGPPASGRYFIRAGKPVDETRRGECCVLLAGAGADEARALLAAGYGTVLLCDAALKDASALSTLAQDFGGDRVGVHVSVARLQNSWTMDVESNADFRFMRPTTPEPNWEILLADGRRTGTLADWWLGEMFRLNAGTALVEHPLDDDADLNICAGLVERFGTRLWFAPRQESAAVQVADLLQHAHVRRLVLPSQLAGAQRPAAELRSAPPVPAPTQEPSEAA